MTTEYPNPVIAMNDALLQIEKQKRNFNNDLSTIDTAISDVYHDIERDESIDLYKGYLYTMKLKNLHKARRELKEQFEQIKTLERNFNVKSAINSMDKAMLKVNREMPMGKRVRTNDLLVSGSIELKSGWKV